MIVEVLVTVLCNLALATQNKYTEQVPGGLSFSEFEFERASMSW